jgi:hypothetical protein
MCIRDRARPPHRPDRPRAGADRPLRSPGEAASDDPRSRSPDRSHLRRRDRRRLAVLDGVEARRLCRSCSADQPVGRALGDRAAIEGRLEDAALGGGRGRKPGLAPVESLPRALPADGRAPRQKPREVIRRSQTPDHLLAHALSRAGLPTQPPERRRPINCPGKLLPLSGRLTVLHGIEKPRQLPRTICAASAEREMSSTQHTGSRRSEEVESH